jgi:hypothetical protein
MRYRAVNAIFARMLPDGEQAPRARSWLANTLAN